MNTFVLGSLLETIPALSRLTYHSWITTLGWPCARGRCGYILNGMLKKSEMHRMVTENVLANMMQEKSATQKVCKIIQIPTTAALGLLIKENSKNMRLHIGRLHIRRKLCKRRSDKLCHRLHNMQSSRGVCSRRSNCAISCVRGIRCVLSPPHEHRIDVFDVRAKL